MPQLLEPKVNALLGLGRPSVCFVLTVLLLAGALGAFAAVRYFYRYILIRLAAIATDRRAIARSGGIALEERVKPLDITPYAGLGASLERIDRDGVACVQTQYPLQLYIVGYDGRRPAWARLTFRSSHPVSVTRQLGVRTSFADGTLIASVRATGSEPSRRVTLTINAILSAGVPPPGVFPPAMPLEGLALTAMRAQTGTCTVWRQGASGVGRGRSARPMQGSLSFPGTSRKGRTAGARRRSTVRALRGFRLDD